MQLQVGLPFLGGDLPQFGPVGVGAFDGLIDRRGRRLEEAHLVGQFDGRVGIDVEEAREPEQGGFERRPRDDELLFAVLKLHVGAQGIDARTDAVLLQIGGLVVERLRQIHLRLRGCHVRGGALAAEILGDHQQNALFPRGDFPGAAGIDAKLRGAVTTPQGQIEDRRFEIHSHLERLVGSGVLGQTGKGHAEEGVDVEAMVRLLEVPVGLRQEAGARHQPLLLAFGHAQVGQDYHGVLLEREVHRVPQRELERRGRLGHRAGSQRHENKEVPVEKESRRVHVHHHQYNQPSVLRNSSGGFQPLSHVE